MTTSPARIEIVIDELVVRGLAPEQARVAATALEARLGAIASPPEVQVHPRSEAFRRLPAIEVPAGSSVALGEAVAGSVWSALSGGGAG
jgi:hypothetical protein